MPTVLIGAGPIRQQPGPFRDLLRRQAGTAGGVDAERIRVAGLS